jgi:hypothetical protein
MLTCLVHPEKAGKDLLKSKVLQSSFSSARGPGTQTAKEAKEENIVVALQLNTWERKDIQVSWSKMSP